MAVYAPMTACCGLMSKVAAIPATNSSKGMNAFVLMRTYLPKSSKTALNAWTTQLMGIPIKYSLWRDVLRS